MRRATGPKVSPRSWPTTRTRNRRARRPRARCASSWLRDLAALPPRPGHCAARIRRAHAWQLADHRLRQGGFRVSHAARPSGNRGLRSRRCALSGASSASGARVGRICAMHSSRAAACQLATFFEQWLTRSGLPKLRIENAAAEGNRVRVTVAQTEPVYVLQVPLVLESGTGRETHLVELSALRKEFVIDTTSAPTAVALDPDLRLARRLDSKELPPILRQVMIDAGTVTGRSNIEERVSRRCAKTRRQAAGQFTTHRGHRRSLCQEPRCF